MGIATGSAEGCVDTIDDSVGVRTGLTESSSVTIIHTHATVEPFFYRDPPGRNVVPLPHDRAFIGRTLI